MIRNRINWWRHHLQIDTKTEFAALLGVTRSQVSTWEAQKAQPGVETSWRISRILNCKIEDLFEWPPE